MTESSYPDRASSTGADGTPAPGTYRLDPDRTVIRADVRAMFGLLMVHGTFKLRAGTVTISEDPAGSGVEASIEAGSFASGNDSRDRDVVSASLLDAATYPEITFAGRGARQDGGQWALPGSVTAHGATDPVEVRVEAAGMEGDVARFRATAHLDRTRLGVTQKKGMVGRAVRLTIDAVGVRS